MNMEEKFGEEQKRILEFLEEKLNRELTNDDIAIAGWLARSDFYSRDTIMGWIEEMSCPPVPAEREKGAEYADVVTVFPRSNRVTVADLKGALDGLQDSAFVFVDDVQKKVTRGIKSVEKTKSGKFVYLVLHND